MKKSLLLYFMLFYLFGNSQTININPDTTGPPWLVGPQPVIDQEYLSNFNEHVMSDEAMLDSLPSSWDNSQLSPINFMPEVIVQDYNSCAQVAGVWYTFAYEMNRHRDIPGKTDSTSYPYLFTYNFLNEGDGDNGSSTSEGWNLIKDNGVPCVENYSITNDTNWLTGYDNYLQGTRNKIVQHSFMLLQDSNDLNEIKTWIYNHDDSSSSEGGLVVFYQEGPEDPVSSFGEWVVKGWEPLPNNMAHAMTIVGYDDDVGYDYNENQILDDTGSLGYREKGSLGV